MPRIRKTLLLFLACAAGGLAVVPAAPAETLREALAKAGLATEAKGLANLDRLITSGATLDDAAQFLIAYYVDNGSERLQEPLYFDRLDRKSGRWKSAALTSKDSRVGDADCLGSVLRIEASAENFFVDTHLNPSAGCLLILSRELEQRAALYGWYLARFGDDSVVFHRSEVHFAPVHAAKIALYDPKTKREIPIFPRKPDQAVRAAQIARMKDFYLGRDDWCNKNNDPCDPEWFDTSLVGEVSTVDRTHALAFIISYEQTVFRSGEEKPSGAGRVLYVYRHVDDEARMEYRELLWRDVQAKFGDVPLKGLLEPQRLKQIFGD